MTKRDLVVRISRETGLIQQDVFAVIQKTLDYVTDALVEGDHVDQGNKDVSGSTLQSNLFVSL